MAATTYTARCEREGGWWIVTVATLPGVITQARSLEAARELVTDAVALWLDTTPDRVAVELDVEGTAGARAEWQAAADARAECERLGADAARRARAAVAQLEGMTVRDIAVLLGVSHQRVQQLRGTNRADAKATKPDRPVARPSTRKRVKAEV